MLAVPPKARHAKPSDIFQKQGAWLHNGNLLNCPGEEVAFIGGAKLLAGDREGRAWNASSKEIYPCELVWRPDLRVGHVTLHDPLTVFDVLGVADLDIAESSVFTESAAGIGIKLERQAVFKARKVQAKGLPAGSGADLDNLKSHRGHSLRDLWWGRFGRSCIVPEGRTGPQED
ncbi:hypothetical protein Pmi06nite_75900 [Planotetraspora mira]|uniref:Uncharacterized protein n=1 Tax=Planotetraspora mira TaxID=58121 RepID=A0A8J3TVZ3_9ACTN|nr:hypothetical protein Pmi06nite_75900 [Planotetraspora mira]